MQRGTGEGGLGGVHYRAERSLLVVADSAAAGEKARRDLEREGYRVADVAGIEGGAERIDAQIAADAILLALEADPGEALDPVLDRLDARSRAGRNGTVVVAPLALVDRLFARGLDEDIAILCEPTPVERALAVSLATAPRKLMLNDIGKGQATARLQQLSEEVARIASTLAALSEDDAIVAAAAAVEAEDGERAPITAPQIRAIIRARRLRDHFFQRDLFADPAWDMLLDLMAARAEKQRVAVSSLCIAAAVPPTTALRWIKTLCDQGLFVRVADQEDGRRVFIELADPAAQALEAYLRAAQRISPLIV
jgi:DNA-binding MarR family transcriptional regulator